MELPPSSYPEPSLVVEHGSVFYQRIESLAARRQTLNDPYYTGNESGYHPFSATPVPQYDNVYEYDPLKRKHVLVDGGEVTPWDVSTHDAESLYTWARRSFENDVWNANVPEATSARATGVLDEHWDRASTSLDPAADAEWQVHLTALQAGAIPRNTEVCPYDHLTQDRGPYRICTKESPMTIYWNGEVYF